MEDKDQDYVLLNFDIGTETEDEEKLEDPEEVALLVKEAEEE